MKRKTIACALALELTLTTSPLLPVTAAAPESKEVDALQYTYEIQPLLAPFNEYFFVKTDNPHPDSFRFSDKDSPYSESSVIYGTDTLYADVEYEQPELFRVNGGYIFKSSTTNGGEITLQVQESITREEYNIAIYGEPDPEFTGYSPWHGMPVDAYKQYDESGWSYTIRGYFKWADTDVTLTLPELYDDCDYLIKTYATGEDFFADMDAVQEGFSSICFYSGSNIRGELYAASDRDWRLYPAAHVDQSFYIYSPYSRKDNKSLLASVLYPYRYDSLGFPSVMGSVSARLSADSTYEWSDTSHAHINVTYDGTTKTYGGQGNGEGQGVAEENILRVFRFGEQDESTTLTQAQELLAEYAAIPMEDDIPRENALTWEKIYNTVGDGAWVDMGSYYTYLYPTNDKASFSADEWGVGHSIYWGGSLGYCRDTWVDGRYVNKTFFKGATFEEHPESKILLTSAEMPEITAYEREWDKQASAYRYTSAEVVMSEQKNVLFNYDAASQTWKAYVKWGESVNSYDTFTSLTEQGVIDAAVLDALTLTREEAEAIVCNGKSGKNPESGYLFDGYAPQGKPFLQGDCDADGTFGVTDVVALQRWLLAVPDAALADWKMADFSGNEVLDAFDLCIMKRELLAK